MNKLVITKPGESWGEAGRRTHHQESELVAEDRAGWVTFSVKQGAVNSFHEEHTRAEAIAAVSIRREDVKVLSRFLQGLVESWGDET